MILHLLEDYVWMKQSQHPCMTIKQNLNHCNKKDFFFKCSSSKMCFGVIDPKRFENPVGGSMKFLPNFWREGI